MSDLIEAVARELGVAVRREGSMFLFPLHECGRIVEACKSRGLLILGIEAFNLSQGSVIPDMDFIADFSELVKQEWNAGCLQAAQASQTYFNEATDRSDLWFEFTLMRRE